MGDHQTDDRPEDGANGPVNNKNHRRTQADGGSNNDSAVGLRGHLSNPDVHRQIERLIELLARAAQQPVRPVPTVRPPHRLNQRLSPETIAELVAAYDSGCTADQLSERYKIGKVGVLKLLHQHTVVRQKPASCLSSEQMAEAARLYRSGLSIAAVGQRLGIASSTLFRGFRVHGIPTRARSER